MSNFAFLRAEWPNLFEEAVRAERVGVADPRVACICARRTLELTVEWLYDADSTLRKPYYNDLNAKINDPSMVALVGVDMRAKMELIRRVGNDGVHGKKPVTTQSSMAILGELFQVLYWVARRYARSPTNLPSAALGFDPNLVPRPVSAAVQRKKQAEIQAMLAEFEQQRKDLAEQRAANADLEAELTDLRAQIKTAKQANRIVPDTHDYTEDITRKLYIDLLLAEAGWLLDKLEDREYPVTGLPTPSGKGRVDYVLWDDNGKPLGLVEAKRASKDPDIAGKEQARQYADALERQTGQRPIIFYTNGFETWMWDDLRYPPRRVQGYYTKDELRLLIQRRAGRKKLSAETINEQIVNRHYQTRAIRRIAGSFEADNRRQALLVMATGTGKTRTAIALVDLLARAGWVKRVLFLADRQVLVNQAAKAFKTHAPGLTTVNLLDDKKAVGRVYVCTYQSMMAFADETDFNGIKRFGPGHFDLVIVDEAHRSVYQKYGTLFTYFDSLLVGLTATPRDDIDHNTYQLFHLEDGVPTDNYDLDEAVADKNLVPPTVVDVPLKFPRLGIKYDELSAEEQEQWESTDWAADDGDVPDMIDADDLNKFLFNADTIDKMLETVMEYGLKVDTGEHIGKTIVFARNTKHAKLIAERFDNLYPHFRGDFATVITSQADNAQSLIDKFEKPNSAPYLAISVDMLDTGLDVPAVVNLVFAKRVRSKTKFWQMLGRGTRLCENLFGPGQHKTGFVVFDLGQNVEYFNQNLPTTTGRATLSLREKLFRQRANLLLELDQLEHPGDTPAEIPTGEPESTGDVRWQFAQTLHQQVAGMNPDSIEVRHKLRQVEAFVDPAAWQRITPQKRNDLDEIAGLPTEFVEDGNSAQAKRFDYLMLRLEYACLTGEPSFAALQEQVRDIATELLSPDLQNIPAVAKHHDFLEDICSDAWWEDVTLPMLETLRRRLRTLVANIKPTRRSPVYTDFTDELGQLHIQELTALSGIRGKARFEAKVRAYLAEHVDQIAIQKLRRNRQITTMDVAFLENIFLAEGFGTAEDVEQAKSEHDGQLGLFVRAIAGLDEEAAIAAFDKFQESRTLSANQLDFIKLLIKSITMNGIVEIGALYDPPFSRMAPRGPEELFSDKDLDAMQEVLTHLRTTAIPIDAQTA
ncbi:DEAD/DEAH box helicase family protein [Nocardia arizonensis]|uniref:DEAD/DEAH box helicase family protein n=1 Tax=Nocardia arizonensis TaxID=1141647 RepID=UPI0006D094A9|nr:DEAD/DEAH box helicase family protein [Nocardia arizonensis]